MSSRSRHAPTNYPAGTGTYIRRNARAFRDLLAQDVPLHGREDCAVSLRQLKHRGLVERVGICNQEYCDTDRRRCRARLYRWRQGAEAFVRERLPDADATPCPNGFGGVKNVRGETGYTCSADDCDCRFSRAEAREVLEQR